MDHALHTWSIALCLGVGLSGQEPAAGLQLHGAEPRLATLLAVCTTSLRAQPAAANGMEAAFTALGQLRLGDPTAARDTLAAAWSNARGDDAAALPRDDLAWYVVAHYWYLRACRDPGPMTSHWPELQGALRRAEAASRTTFVQEAMFVHGMFCLGGMLDTRDRIETPTRWQKTQPSPRPGAPWTQRAIERICELEASTWQPGRGHFRPHLTAGAIVLPEPADLSVLVPAAAGLLIATQDRLLRHLRTVVGEGPAATRAASATAAPFLPFGKAFELSAATQVEDEAARTRCWNAILEALDPERLPAAHAGALIDAALFAVTGLRLATGAGVDEDVVRMRPWLPPHHDHLRLRGLSVDGASLDLELSLRTCPFCRDEADEPALADLPAAAPRLRVRLALVATPGDGARSVVLQGAGTQYLAELRPGAVLERSLPRLWREAQHEARSR
ncbi:MAG TPA: hypothetical protein VFD82_15220 [Planctomycetota bacterium]|nr:hypothetical protein [Planctomycetota bacterium]